MSSIYDKVQLHKKDKDIIKQTISKKGFETD